MKRFLSIVAIALTMAMAGNAYAQQNAIKLNIFSLAISTYNISYERAINDNGSFQLGFFYLGHKWGETSFNGFALTPEYRYYFDEVLNGFYVAPYLRYQNYSLKESYVGIDSLGNSVDREAKGSISLFGGGLVAGHQWLLGEHFTIDVFLGPGYNAGSAKASDDTDPDYEFSTNVFDGFSIRWGFTFGFAF